MILFFFFFHLNNLNNFVKVRSLQGGSSEYSHESQSWNLSSLVFISDADADTLSLKIVQYSSRTGYGTI